MNAYDFDGTIYQGDSSVQFWLFCLRRYPWLLACLPWQLWGMLLYRIGVFSKTRMKECFFSFLRGTPDAESLVSEFWKKYESGVETWYLNQQAEDDVILSASPDFLLRPLCQRIGIRHLIASRVHEGTGMFEGENCYGEEKVRRFRELFPAGAVQCFYSDSASDTPMARIAAEAYLVSTGKFLKKGCRQWPF